MVMKGNFILDREIFHSIQEELEAKLTEMGLKNAKKKIEKLEKSNDWIEDFSEKDLKLIVNAVCDLNSEMTKVKIEDEDDINYKYDDLRKKAFLLSLSSQVESIATVMKAAATFDFLEKDEEKKNKCVLKFTNSDIEETLIDLFGEMKYHRLRSRLKVLSRFSEFYGHEEDLGNWKTYSHPDKIYSVLGDIEENKIYTKDDLISLFEMTRNPQESIIPILIFEGAKFSKIEDLDEVRHIKKNDLLDGKLRLTGNGEGKTTEREIEIDSATERMIKQAAAQKLFIKDKGNYQRILNMVDSEYVLRPNIAGKIKSSDGEKNNKTISFRGAYDRIKNVKENTELEWSRIDFTPQGISNCGKIHYINRLVTEGMDVYDAIRETLKRFGEWKYSEDGRRDVSLPHNTQNVNRLFKLWELYK